MKRASSGPCLSAVFVDYDNIYLSLKRKNERAAKRFAKDVSSWLKEIASGRLITPTNSLATGIERRIVMNRCYGNPVPRRNSRDNSTDMNSFPFVRHNFLRAGCEIIDCPPLTAQLKNSSDIRMVMDVRDLLNHDTYYDEFIILSGDADFTPVLHRLRAHARRTVIFANDYTAVPYTAICDGEIREADLIRLLVEGRLPHENEEAAAAAARPSVDMQAAQSAEIMAEVVATVAASDAPVPIEALADRAQRALGHERTIGTNWAGHGAFRTFLLQNLPQDIVLTEQAPYFAYDANRHNPAPLANTRASEKPAAIAEPEPELTASSEAPSSEQAVPVAAEETLPVPAQASEPALAEPQATVLQQSIARIHEACKAPPLAPPEYRMVFEILAAEINENGLSGPQTLTNVGEKARQAGLELVPEDIRFVLKVVSEADPWFEQGASANLFAGRFRNFVVAMCRSKGLNLSVDELDLIDAWFAGGGATAAIEHQPATPAPSQIMRQEKDADKWWSEEEQQSRQQAGQLQPADSQAGLGQDDVAMPRIIREQMRG